MTTTTQKNNARLERRAARFKAEGFSGLELARKTRTLVGYVRNRLLFNNEDLSGSLSAEELIAVNWPRLVEDKRTFDEQRLQETEKKAEAAKLEASILKRVDREGVLLCSVRKSFPEVDRYITEIAYDLSGHIRKIGSRYKILPLAVEALQAYAAVAQDSHSETEWKRRGFQLKPTARPAGLRRTAYGGRYFVFPPTEVEVMQRERQPRPRKRKAVEPVATEMKWQKVGF